MSEKVEVEIFHRGSFSWVFQRTDRGMPSISIQGDSLGILVSQLAIGLDALQKGQVDKEAELELQDAFETLDAMRTLYMTHGWVKFPESAQEQENKNKKTRTSSLSNLCQAAEPRRCPSPLSGEARRG